jgi:hypothetical protein
MNQPNTNNEVARLRKYIERLEIYSPENEWSQPEWRKLIGSKEENEDPDTLFKLYQFRLAPEPEEPVSDWKCPHCGSTTGTWFSRVEPMGDICEDCGKSVDEELIVVNPEPSNLVVDQNANNMSNKEWRELGPDEVIQEGDEVFSLGMWIPVSPNLVIPINDKRKPEVRFRTLRPFPKEAK